MKLLAIIFSLLMIQDAFAQDCVTVAQNKSQPITRYPDNFMNLGTSKPASWDITRMKPHQATVESWIRNLLTGFTGAKVGYTSEYSMDHVNGGSFVEDFYKTTGIKGYCFSTTRFWAYYCLNEKLLTEGEAGSFIYVTFNNIFASHNLTEFVGTQTVNGKFAFTVLEKSHSEGRIDFYDHRKRMDFSDTVYTSKNEIILIRNSDKPVFIAFTRKEYLQHLLKDVEASRVKYKELMTGIYDTNAKDFEKEMKAYKLDKAYTPEKEAKRRKWFEEDQAKRAKLIKEIDPDTDASLDVINKYLQKPNEWLDRHVGSFFSYSHYSAKGLTYYLEHLDIFSESKEDFTRSEIVYLNPDYFNKSLGNDAPQLIMVELIKTGYKYMYKLSDKVKQPGVLSGLAAMVR